MEQIFIQRLRQDAVLPCRATPQSAGLDLCACIEKPISLLPDETVLVPTGLAAAPARPDVALLIFARSGLASKSGIALANGVGVVDSDYRGEICVALRNFSQTPFIITPAMRIAQMVAAPVFLAEICETASLPNTLRGSGGFGSTGISAPHLKKHQE